MRFSVHPEKLGVIAQNDSGIDPVVTQLIRDKGQVELRRIQGVTTLQPILQLRLDTPRNLQEAFFVVVRFEYMKDGKFLLIHAQPQPFATELIYFPEAVIDLSLYRSGRSKIISTNQKRLLGEWGIKTRIAAVSQEEFSSVTKRRRAKFLLDLPYRDLTDFSWEVIPKAISVRNIVNETGQRRQARPRNEHDRSVDISNI